MKYLAIAGLAIVGIVATSHLAVAQTTPPDFDSALMNLASPGSVIGTATVEATERGEMFDAVEGPDGVEGPEAIEGPETPGDSGPNIDHQFEGEETGENGNGVPGPGGR
jgi:hypothetical protein